MLPSSVSGMNSTVARFLHIAPLNAEKARYCEELFRLSSSDAQSWPFLQIAQWSEVKAQKESYKQWEHFFLKFEMCFVLCCLCVWPPCHRATHGRRALSVEMFTPLLACCIMCSSRDSSWIQASCCFSPACFAVCLHHCGCRAITCYEALWLAVFVWQVRCN